MVNMILEPPGREGLNMVMMTAPETMLYYNEANASNNPDLTPLTNPGVLLVREEGVHAANTVMHYLLRGQARSIAVAGTSGIGKTMWSNYLLKRCHDEKHVVVVRNMREQGGMLLLPDMPAKKLATASDVELALLKYAAAFPLYLCDTGKGATDYPVEGINYVLVLTTSPETMYIGQWAKGNHEEIWMSPWTEEQLRLALPRLLRHPGPAMEALALERYQQVGGNLRAIVQEPKSYDEFLQDTASASDGPALDQLATLVREAKHRSIKEIERKFAPYGSQKLVRVWPMRVSEAGETRGYDLQVQFASSAVADQLRGRWLEEARNERHLASLLREIKGVMGRGSWHGDTHDIWFLLCIGVLADHPRPIEVWDMISDRQDSYRTMTLKHTSLVVLNRKLSELQVSLLRNPVVGMCVQAPSNWPGVDGWLYMELEGGRREIWLLQVTEASDHPVSLPM